MSKKKKKKQSYKKVEEKKKVGFIDWVKENLVLVISAVVTIALIITVAVLASTANKGNDNNGGGSNSGTVTGDPSKTDVMGTGACEYLESRDITGRDIKYVEMCVENYGRVVILLDATTAPETVANFVSLVNKGFYDGLTFHRIMEGFMIQGGDPLGNGTGGNTDANGNEINIKGEFDENGHPNDISHKYGVISMARAGTDNVGNQGRDTASSQFFICNADASSSLDGKYAAFGYVVEGMSVIDAITTGTINEVKELYGNDFIYWLYYENGSINSTIQPKIKYIKVLDSWEG